MYILLYDEIILLYKVLKDEGEKNTWSTVWEKPWKIRASMRGLLMGGLSEHLIKHIAIVFHDTQFTLQPDPVVSAGKFHPIFLSIILL